jgi:hypothetical protein
MTICLDTGVFLQMFGRKQPFSDCAIAAEADFLVTEDRHFEVLELAGYCPQASCRKTCIRPEIFCNTSPIQSR